MEPGGTALEQMPELRRRIYEVVLASPGMGISDLAKGGRCLWTSAFIQVEHLRRAGLVRTVKLGRRRAVFPESLLDGIEGNALALLAEPACRRVAMAIVSYPDKRVWELSSITDMSDRAVHHHVKKLTDANLASPRKIGAYRGILPGPQLSQLFGTNRPRSEQDRQK